MNCSKSIVLAAVISSCLTALLYEVLLNQSKTYIVTSQPTRSPYSGKQSQNSKSEHAKEKWFEEEVDKYIKLHNEIFDGKRPPYYAKGDIGHGWGNVFQMAASYLLFGMISGRAVVFWPMWHKNSYFFEHFDEYFERPPINIMHYPKDLLEERWPEKQRGQFVGVADYTSCLNLTEVERNKPMISLISPGLYDFWAPAMQMNEKSQYFNKLPINWFHILTRKVFIPRRELQDYMEKFKKENFGKFNVGIQIRVWMRGGTDSVVLPRIPTDVFLQAAELVSNEYPTLEPEKDVKFFISTTEPDIIEHAKSVYGNRVIFVDENSPDAHSVNGTKMGLVNMYLLGATDDIVTTEVSSYGANAAALAGMKPIMCTHERICYRRLTPEPCHFEPFPIRRRSCSARNPFIPGIQSTCAYWSNQVFKRKWFDFYNSWDWTTKEMGSKIEWKIGDDGGNIY